MDNMTRNYLQPTPQFPYSASLPSRPLPGSSQNAQPQQLPSIHVLLRDDPLHGPVFRTHADQLGQQQLPVDDPGRTWIADVLSREVTSPPTPDTMSPHSTPATSPSPVMSRRGRTSSRDNGQASTELCPHCGKSMNDPRHVKQIKEQKSRKEEQDHRRDIEDMLSCLGDLMGGRQQTKGNGNSAGLRGVKLDLDQANKRLFQFFLVDKYKEYAARGDIEGFQKLIREARAQDPLVELLDHDRCRKVETCQKKNKKRQGAHNEKMCVAHGEPDWRACHEKRRDWRCALNIARWHLKNHLSVPLSKMGVFARVDQQALAAQLRKEGLLPPPGNVDDSMKNQRSMM